MEIDCRTLLAKRSAYSIIQIRTTFGRKLKGLNRAIDTRNSIHSPSHAYKRYAARGRSTEADVMSHLRQKTLVACPLAQAKRRMEVFMKDNGSANGSVLRAPFGFCLAAHPNDTTLRIEREVTLSLVISSRVTAIEASWNVEWKSSEGGPYPAFTGELAVENDDYKTFWLVLEGSYEPPLGVVGTAFDLLVGNRIASQSARELLARIASSMEAGFQIDEAAKPHTQALPT